ncbi:MAG: hypothetical protein ABSD96_04560 [Candidatus Korobacteraceae bacterium]
MRFMLSGCTADAPHRKFLSLQILRFAQDFGRRLGRRLNASTSGRSYAGPDTHLAGGQDSPGVEVAATSGQFETSKELTPG